MDSIKIEHAHSQQPIVVWLIEKGHNAIGNFSWQGEEFTVFLHRDVEEDSNG